MRRIGKPPFIAALAATLLTLASCVSLEEAGLRFNADSSGELTFQLLVDKKGLKDDALPETLIASINDCGFTGRQTNRPDEILVDAIGEFKSGTVMAANLKCLPTDWTKREISLSRDSGWFYKYYTITIWLEQPMIAYSDNVAIAPHFNREGDDIAGEYQRTVPLIPATLTVDAPARIVEIIDESDIPDGTVTSSFSENRATISLRWADELTRRDALLDPLVAALNRRANPDIPVDRYKVVVRAREARFDLTTVISVAVGLFGSGMAVVFSGWLSRRTSKSAKPAKPPRRSRSRPAD